MGDGYFAPADNTFRLFVSLRFEATEADLQAWEKSFRQASVLLHKATNGQMRFGRVDVYNNRAGGDKADAYGSRLIGSANTNLIPGLGIVGGRMNLLAHVPWHPYTIIHEFGHYALGLYDEYEPVPAQCSGDPDQGVCIMEHGRQHGDRIDEEGNIVLGKVHQFCDAATHRIYGPATEQHINNDEACWETIQKLHPLVTIPPNTPAGPMPGPPEPLEWCLIPDESRFALLLNTSPPVGAMSRRAMRHAARYWLDYMAVTGEQLGIVILGRRPTAILPLGHEIEASLRERTNLILERGPDRGAVSATAAAAAGWEQMRRAGGRVATQCCLLVSAPQQADTPANELVDQLRDQGIRVHTLSLPEARETAGMRELAARTHGTHLQVGEARLPEMQVLNHLVQLSGEIRDGGTIVDMAALALPPGAAPPRSVPAAARPAEVALTPVQQPPDSDLLLERPKEACVVTPSGFTHRSWIERGARRATFVVTHPEDAHVRLVLKNPAGRTVRAAQRRVAIVNHDDSPTAFVSVLEPDEGPWTLEAYRRRSGGELPLKVFVFGENRRLQVALSVQVCGRRADFTATASYDLPLAGLVPPRVSVVPPDYAATGTWINVRSTILRQKDPRRRGVYTGCIEFPRPGEYLVEVALVNAGKARAVNLGRSRAAGQRIEVPRFRRLIRRQLYIE
ncbi:MAG: hypothetical protein J5I93_03375 [Pirellulaceae bacterium]|nr:hypothetical protein [Pirellulaceae bacterium]